MAAALTALATPWLVGQAQSLNLLQLGEWAAFYVGLDVERCKSRVALGTATRVGAVTSATGPIGFIGLVAPHLARRPIIGRRHCRSAADSHSDGNCLGAGGGSCGPPRNASVGAAFGVDRQLAWRAVFSWLPLRSPMDHQRGNCA